MAAGDITLGANQYGKAECRLVRVQRDTARHAIDDLTVTSQLRGDFADCHISGDNSKVVATDTQRNTVYAFARRHGITTPERFLLLLARHFTGEFDWVTGGRWLARAHPWQRIEVGGAGHDHAFVAGGTETRTAAVHADPAGLRAFAGVDDLTVLKSTGSGFSGFPRDAYTTLAETDDRILATSVTAWWRYREQPSDFDAHYAAVRERLLTTFAEPHSLALQQTLFAMGRAVLEACPDIAEIRLSMPNNHHFLVDLEPFGLDNPGEVFFAADRPYGLIEAAVVREGEPEDPAAWSSITGFC
jgi:urate oxidase